MRMKKLLQLLRIKIKLLKNQNFPLIKNKKVMNKMNRILNNKLNNNNIRNMNFICRNNFYKIKEN